MRCPECNCKFKGKFQLWTEDNEVICPVCKCYIKVESKDYSKERKMIVKVQISIVSRNENVMVYNEDETLLYQFLADKDVLEKADGRFKFFCKAEIVNKKLVLGEEVEDQEW